MNDGYLLEPMKIKTVFKQENLFGEEIIVVFQNGINNYENICVENYGWLKNYLFNNKDELDESKIGTMIYAIKNSTGGIECFSDKPDSIRVDNIFDSQIISNRMTMRT